MLISGNFSCSSNTVLRLGSYLPPNNDDTADWLMFTACAKVVLSLLVRSSSRALRFLIPSFRSLFNSLIYIIFVIHRITLHKYTLIIRYDKLYHNYNTQLCKSPKNLYDVKVYILIVVCWFSIKYKCILTSLPHLRGIYRTKTDLI